MSVEANHSWIPQFGDVGKNKTLTAVLVLDESCKSVPDARRSASDKDDGSGEARESTKVSGVIEKPDSCGGSQKPSYKDAMISAMDFLASDPLVRFIGYGVKIGGRAMGTLKNVPESQLIEMPVAENLMASFAIGLSLKGLKPVVFFERFDFVLNALDAIVNHLDKIETISHGEFKPAMILRIVVGNRRKPLFTGKTHTQDFSVALRALVSFPVYQLQDASQIVDEYKRAWHGLGFGHSYALIEYKDFM